MGPEVENLLIKSNDNLNHQLITLNSAQNFLSLQHVSIESIEGGERKGNKMIPWKKNEKDLTLKHVY